MRLHCLRAEGFRNLKDLNIKPNASLNLIIGPNGSGKTSILEAIYVLALGRSFRTRDLQPVVTHQRNRLICYAEVEAQSGKFSMGAEKREGMPLILQANGQTNLKLTEFIGHLAAQVITPDSFSLLTDGPETRRRFIDLGVFHVKHSFIEQSLRYKRLLKHRNAALKQQSSSMIIRAIDEGFAHVALLLSSMRQFYLDSYIPVFKDVLSYFLPDISFKCTYYQGWNQQVEFSDALRASLEQDLRYRSTQVGPHRADLKFEIDGYPAQHILSRGQQKLFVSAMILAQAIHLSQINHIKTIFLIDDLASELDKHNLSLVLNWLLELGHQIFLTSVEEDIWEDLCQGRAYEMFHVKHGKVTLRSLVK